MATFNGCANLDGVNSAGTIPAAGFKGSVLQSVITSTTAFGATNTAYDITSITLTAGTWLITGAVNISGSTFAGSQLAGWFGTTSGNSTAELVAADTASFSPTIPTVDSSIVLPLPPKIYSVSGTSVIYLKVRALYTVLGNGVYSGTIRAVCIA